LKAHKRTHHGLVIPLEGRQFAKLTVVDRHGSTTIGTATWNCVCECGNKTIAEGGNLRFGRTKSCGCLRSESLKKNRRDWLNVKHGDNGSAEHTLWMAMLARCAGTHPRYGGRGITVSEAWRTSYATFLADMGRRPSPELTIERVNNNKGYSKDNCVWATRSVQARNTRRNHLVTALGKTQCIVEWAEETGIPATAIKSRLNKLGWSEERSVTQPLRGSK